MKGKNEKATNSLKRFRDDEVEVQNELNELIKEEETRKSLKVLDALHRKSSKKAILIAFGLMFFQQLSGINAVIFYTNAIFTDAKLELEPKYATIIVGVIQVVATLVSTMTVDKVGRKVLLVISFTLMALCTMTLGVYNIMKDNNESSVEGLGWITLLALCVFIIAFSLGAGPLPWLCLSEIFASDVRAIAGSLTGTLNWTLAFAVTVTYPPVKEIIGPGPTFFIFTACSFVGIIFVRLIVPETKGISMAEIQKLLGD
jgi:Na+/melibiose symporter-like transporter